jgi:transcriptional regulator PpsR
VTGFRAPRASFGKLDAVAAAGLVAAASDIALVVDGGGVIHDVSVTSKELSRDLAAGEAWHGRLWLDTVTEESRPKVEELIRDAAAGATPRWRHVNQVAPSSASVPILYSAVRLGGADRAVVIGRDLRPISVLQQRLVEAQQSVERDYARLRHAEMRYRLLFQVSPEPVLIVDAPGGRVVELNPAAIRLFGKTAQRMVGRPLAEVFTGGCEEAVRTLLSSVRALGRPDEVRVQLDSDHRDVTVAASVLRQEGELSFLVRVTPTRAEAQIHTLPKPQSKLLKLVEGAPDGFVVADHQGRILTANNAFREMAQLTAADQVEGESLDRWLGRPGVELDVLLATLRQRGSVRFFATNVRGELGSSIEVELSAASVMNGGGRPCYGFAIRDVGIRPSAGSALAQPLRSVEQLKELIGRVPLKDVVREATDVIERLCIEAALQLTGDNRASAAEMLGLSRQSLYVKLRRYGVGDLGPENAAEPDRE